MAEVKTIALIAVERGFRAGRMVEPGTKFPFEVVSADGKTRKLPKWAVKAEDYTPKGEKPKNGDLKPKDAQVAAKGKLDGLAQDLAG